jgi:membrane associated rhomboid family serine protease
MRPDDPLGHREPLINAPRVIVGLILVLILIHVLRGFLSDASDVEILLSFGFVPARLALAFDPGRYDDIAARAVEGLTVGSTSERLLFVKAALDDGSLKPWTFVTYAFLHGSLPHLALNSLWLLAFGSPVARRFGDVRFLLFFLVCAVAGAIAYALVRSTDVIPMVGASGAISGAMAAATRFALRSDVPLIVLRADPGVMDRLPALPLAQALADRRVLVFLIVWFGTNLVFGLVPALSEGTVAWEAHVGGFLVGLLFFPLFDPVRQRLPARR